jgi:hypothetical protein
MRLLLVNAGVLLLLAAGLPLAAQTSSEPAMDKARTGARPGEAPIDNPGSVLKIVKLKGTLDKIDLQTRTVTISPEKKEAADLLLTFPQPKGREQVRVSKKAEKQLGKKKLDLEELKTGSKVTLEYYPALQQVMSLTIEQHAS